MMKRGVSFDEVAVAFQMKTRAVDYAHVPGLGYDSGYFSYIIGATACLYGRSSLRIIEGAAASVSSLLVER
jgi:hypothetical protein